VQFRFLNSEIGLFLFAMFDSTNPVTLCYAPFHEPGMTPEDPFACQTAKCQPAKPWYAQDSPIVRRLNARNRTAGRNTASRQCAIFVRGDTVFYVAATFHHDSELHDDVATIHSLIGVDLK
jgi:hypothetical protein